MIDRNTLESSPPSRTISHFLFSQNFVQNKTNEKKEKIMKIIKQKRGIYLIYCICLILTYLNYRFFIDVCVIWRTN